MVFWQYNNAVTGGLLTLDSWVSLFPIIDTVHTTGAAQAQAARVQGKQLQSCPGPIIMRSKMAV